MNPETVRQWSRRLIKVVLLGLGLLVVAMVLVEAGVFGPETTETIESVLDAIDTFSRTF